MLTGSFLVFVAISVVRNFSVRSVKLFCGTLAFFLYGTASDYCRPYLESVPKDQTPSADLIYLMVTSLFLAIPILVAIAFYRLAKARILKWTRNEE